MGMDGCLYSGKIELTLIIGNGRVSVQRDHGGNINLWEWMGVCKAGSWK